MTQAGGGARRRTAALALVVLLSGCSLLAGEDADRPAPGVVRLDPERSMTEAGQQLAGDRLAQAPRYDVRARVTPRDGRVVGTVHADLPAPTDGERLTFRYFAGLPGLDARPRLGEVLVDGEPVRAVRDGSVVHVPVAQRRGPRVEVVMPFRYTLPRGAGTTSLLDQLGGLGGPAEVGLLARRPDAVNLGHWFPLQIPPGASAEPEPTGFGDIGNFAAATIRSELTVPEAWTVVDGGVRVDDQAVDGMRTVVSEGYGMRDLAAVLLRDPVSRSTTQADLAGGQVTVTAYGPASSRAHLAEVLDETVVALEVLSDAFGAYPWRELDVVAAPLGPGVGGMEWPGTIWIEPDLFAGGIPGLGGLLDGLEGLGGLDGLELPGGLDLPGGLEDLLRTQREWTIAHEVGHEWWHAVVGNDSTVDPVVDEPLAQHSACLVMRATRPDEAGSICAAHIETAYTQMRLFGLPDVPATRPTDGFEASGQYAGVVYGKAAAFYATLEDEFGRDEVTRALRAVVRDHAFATLDDEGLRTALAASLGRERFDSLWERWMEGRHGDADLGVRPGETELPGLEGLDLDGLGELLSGLTGPNGPVS